MNYRKQVWDGKIPLKISHPEAENDPLYLLTGRCSYLPFLFVRIRKHFSAHLSPELFGEGGDLDIWFSYQDKPLPWHYPLGLLWDLLVKEKNGNPLELRVYFSNYPFNEIIKMHSYDSLQDYFISMLKQSDFIRNGNCKQMMMLPKNQQQQLWDSLWSENYEKFWQVNQELLKGKTPKHVAIRVYHSLEEPFWQDLIPILTSDQKPTTVQFVIDLYKEQNNIENDTEKDILLIHGIHLPFDTPLQWLHEEFVFPDNFLHFIYYKQH